MELVQSVMLVREEDILCNASTWKSTGKIGAVDTGSIESLKYTVLDVADEFIYDHMMANAKE